MRLIAAQFTIANTWEQPKGPLTDEWIKTYIYTTERYSTIKKNAVMPFAAIWLDLEIIILSDVKSHRERQMLYDIIYMQNLKKNDTSELIYKTEADPQTYKTNYGYQGGRVGVRDSLGV